jgi:hypothetical protein
MNDLKPASRSLTLRGAAAMALAYALSRLGLDVDGGAQPAIEALLDLVFALGAMGVGVGRARAAGPL